MKLYHKLGFAFVVLVVIMAFGLLYNTATAKQSMTHIIGANTVSYNTQILAEIDRSIAVRIQEFQIIVSRDSIISLIKDSNQFYDERENPNAYIQQQELHWTQETSDQHSELVSSLINNTVSEQLRTIQHLLKKESGNVVVGEIFITNKYGANVAQTGKTSDYYQADEEWWEQAWETGLHIKDAEYDESADMVSVDVSIVVKNEGQKIGVVKFVLNLQDILSPIDRTQIQSENSDFYLTTTNKQIIHATEDIAFFTPLAQINSLTSVPEEDGYTYTKAHFLRNNARDSITVSTTSQGYGEYPGLGWRLHGKYTGGNLFDPLSGLQSSMLTLIFILLIIGIIIAFFTAQKITRPIQELEQVAHKISVSDFSGAIHGGGSDEIENLAQSLQAMRKKLQNHSLNIVEKEQLLKKSNAKLKLANEELKQLDAKKDQFMSLAAHELKTPLTSIKGYTQLLLKGSIKNKKKQKEFLQTIDRNTRTLYQLVTDIVDASRLSLGKLKMNQETVSVQEIIKQTKEETEVTIKRKKLSSKFVCNKDVPLVVGDSNRIMQIMRNLISNAINYTEKGSITVHAKRQGKFVLISVQDTGTGIPKENMKYIFSRFYQVDSTMTRKIGGSGLGLSICKGLITKMGGEIWFESIHNKGTTFSFTVPIKKKRSKK